MEINEQIDCVEPDALQRVSEEHINCPLVYQKVNIRFCIVIG
ncbi:hypothetical protein LEJE111609_20070 [Lelliottia jeotgali]